MVGDTFCAIRVPNVAFYAGYKFEMMYRMVQNFDGGKF